MNGNFGLKERKEEIKEDVDVKKVMTALIDTVKSGGVSNLAEVLKPEGDVFKFAKWLSINNLSGTQLRKIYDTTMEIASASLKSRDQEGGESSIDLELVKILTRIYYAVGRSKGSSSGGRMPEEFKNFFEECVTAIIKEENKEKKQKKLRVFSEILKGIVAYHKYFENTSKKKKGQNKKTPNRNDGRR